MKKFTYEELIKALVNNCNNMGYDDVASIYNDSCQLACTGEPVAIVYPDAADEPEFLEVGP